MLGATELVQRVLVATLDVIDILFLFIVLKKGYFSVGVLSDFFSEKGFLGQILFLIYYGLIYPEPFIRKLLISPSVLLIYCKTTIS